MLWNAVSVERSGAARERHGEVRLRQGLSIRAREARNRKTIHLLVCQIVTLPIAGDWRYLRPIMTVNATGRSTIRPMRRA